MYLDSEGKYSPKRIGEYIFPNDEVRKVITAYCSGEVTRPLILSGPNGTGKSLLSRLIPRGIEGFIPEVTYVRARSLMNEKEVLNQFTYNKQFNKLFTVNGQKLGYNIIEEVNIDIKARDAFRTVLDDYRGVDLTIITTNELENIDIGVRSRCEVLEVPPLEPKLFLPHACKIFTIENVEYDEANLLEALEAVYDVKPDNRAYYKKVDELYRTLVLEQASRKSTPIAVMM